MSTSWEQHLDTALRGGESDNFSFSVSKISIADGDPLDLPSAGIIAIVGANNTGKSTLLRQMVEYLSWSNGQPRQLSPSVLSKLEVDRPASPADLIAWLGEHSVANSTLSQGITFHRPAAGAISAADANVYWSGAFGGPETLGTLTNFLVSHANARDRFQWVQPTSRRGSINDVATHPLHVLEQREDLLAELNGLVKEIFGTSLTLDRLSGNIQLRVGQTRTAAPAIDAVTQEYTNELSALKPLAEQGDGMQSVLGVLIPLVTSTYPVVLIDEPEAFLHPPQARILGSALARLSSRRRSQVFVATHDRNIIIGMLEAANVDVSVLRLTREADTTSIKKLSSEDVTEVWRDPVLRYSSILDGLFHRIVVLAENDRDCSFYSAALAHYNLHHFDTVRSHDVLFCSTYGKQAMPRVASSLRDIGVRVVIVPDLDALNEEPLMKQLVASVEGSWDSISRDYQAATAQFRQPRSRQKNKDVNSAISAVLNEAPDDDYNKATKDRVAAALRVDNPWKALKLYGDRAFTADQDSAQSLIESLDKLGIVVVRIGELERFYPSVTKGANWLPAALAAGAHTGNDAQDQVRRILLDR